jgi:YbbR domain-containing protein
MKPSRNGLTQNWGLKIASFLFAVAVWLVVVNINDPSTTASFYNIPVTIENADAISAQGKIYEIEDDTDVVPRVTVYGPRSVLENLDKSDITATADMNNLSSVDTISIDFSTTSNNSQITDIRGSIENVKVSIENKKTVQLVLATKVKGSAPDGYVIGNVSTDQNLVRISGPESLVNQVDQAVVNVDMDTLSGVTSDITTSVSVHLYDVDGNEVTGSTLTDNPDSVIVTVQILPTKEVPVTFKVSGTAAEGYGTTGDVEAEPASVVISGTKKTLANITEIAVPEDVLNITGQDADMKTEVDVTDYLPDGVSLVSGKSDGKIKVTVPIEKVETKTFTIDPDNLKTTNLPENLTCVLQGPDSGLSLTVSGVTSVVEGLKVNDLLETFDVNEWMAGQNMTTLPAGNYSVNLSFKLPDGVTQVGATAATLAVTQNADTAN